MKKTRFLLFFAISQWSPPKKSQKNTFFSLFSRFFTINPNQAIKKWKKVKKSAKKVKKMTISGWGWLFVWQKTPKQVVYGGYLIQFGQKKWAVSTKKSEKKSCFVKIFQKFSIFLENSWWRNTWFFSIFLMKLINFFGPKLEFFWTAFHYKFPSKSRIFYFKNWSNFFIFFGYRFLILRHFFYSIRLLFLIRNLRSGCEKKSSSSKKCFGVKSEISQKVTPQGVTLQKN